MMGDENKLTEVSELKDKPKKPAKARLSDSVFQTVESNTSGIGTPDELSEEATLGQTQSEETESEAEQASTEGSGSVSSFASPNIKAPVVEKEEGHKHPLQFERRVLKRRR